MKILFLSSVHPLLTPADPLPKWQMQASWVGALGRLGHEVRVVKYTPDDRIRLGWGERIWWNIKVIKSILREFIKVQPCRGKVEPFDTNNLIIYSLGADVLLPQALHYIKVKLTAPLVILSGVSPISQGNPRERAMAKYVDLAATNDPDHAKEWLKLGAKRALVLPIAGVDPQLHKGPTLPRQGRTLRDIDVLFVGTLTQERKKFFSKLWRLLPDKIKMVVKEFVWEEKYAKLMSRAKIGVNLLRPEMNHGVNLRAFEIPAFGAMEITNFTRPEWLTPGKEVEVFSSVEEAAGLIKKYLNDDRARERIAEAGRKRVMEEHTFDKRAKQLLESIRVRPCRGKVGPLDNKIDVSACIVNYKTDWELKRCLNTIKKFTKGISYETIVVDNSTDNKWYSGGNNLAAGKAKGRYLFFVNPDVYFEDDAISGLVRWMDKHPKAAAAEPLQVSQAGEVLPTGSKLNSPWLDLVELTFLSRLLGSVWRRGKILNLDSIGRFRQSEFDRSQNWQTESISGAALMVRREIFETVGGFWDGLKLFYTDTDLCRRILLAGGEIWHLGKFHVVHSLSSSTSKLNRQLLNKIYAQDADEYYRITGRPFAGKLLYLSMLTNGRLFLK